MEFTLECTECNATITGSDDKSEFNQKIECPECPGIYAIAVTKIR